MDGVLVIDKPSGPTSFDVVRRVRLALGLKKAGHTGTLDPLATGVLPCCLGEATKLAGFLTEGDKAYDAVFHLGQETDTLDAQGKVLAEHPVPEVTAAGLEAALAPFRGTFLQLPPMYSAVKVGGKRLYEHARAGAEIERAPRQVTVHALELKDFSAAELTVSLRCSKGFFVRVLAHDVGRALGCGAHVKSLRRVASGPFALSQAIDLEALERDPSTAERHLVPSVEALAELPAVRVSDADAGRVLHGVPLEVAAEGQVRVLSADGRLLAVARAKAGRLEYLRVLRGGA